MKMTKTFPCSVTFTWEPEEKATEFETSVDEEFFVDSFKIGGVELVEFLTDEMEEELYKLIKGDCDD